MTALLERWSALTGRARLVGVFGAIAVVYWVALLITGPHGWVHHRAPIGIILVGVVFGSVTAIGAIGLILVFRANRFVNFAHGALGSLIGVMAIGLVKVHGLNYWAALGMAVVAGALVGALIEFLVIRRFRHASRLILTVASIGLAQLLAFFELIGSKHIGFISLTGGFKAPINVSAKIDVYTFHGDEVLMVIAVPLVIAFLAWFLLRTDAGIAVRAAAENHDRALLFGIPVRRLSTIVWLIAGGLTALAFMLQAPFSGVKPGVASNGPTELLPLLAAAVVARMESLPIALGAGIGLGVMEQLVRWNSPGAPSFVYAAYLIIIVGALLLQRGKLSRAEEGAESGVSTPVVKPVPEELRHLPEVRWTKAGLLLLAALAFIVIPHTWGASNQLLAAFGIVWAMIAVSIVVLQWSGNISLGQFGIAGLAAMVGANLVSRWNTDFVIVMLASAAAGALVALLLGIPALRIPGLFLAVTTLAFALALDQYFLNRNTFPKLLPNRVDRPLVVRRFDLEQPYQMYAACLVFLLIAVLLAVGVRKARAGRVLIASRDNKRVADSAGVPTTWVKLSGFMLSGAIAGVAGALAVFLLGSLSPGAFPPADSITVFSYAVIGGLGSIGGAIAGVVIFKFLESFTWLGDLRLGIDGVALLVVLYFFPGGLGQLFFDTRDRLLRRVANRRGIPVPSLVADKRTADNDTPEDETGILEGALEPAGAS